jgi:beta-lactamase class A
MWMNGLWTRRGLIAGMGLLPLSSALAGDNPEGLIAEIEKRAGGRLGVCVFDTQTGRRIRHRADERFPMCSTFKLLLAAAVLHQVDEGQEKLDRRIEYGKADLLDYAPAAREHLGEGGMAVKDMAAATIELSDNTCANKLLASIGGPEGYTRYARSLGDTITRLDRSEPALNTSVPGDPRDTTTPNAMTEDLRRVLLGDALSGPSRMRLTDWLMACKTAAARIPAGLPKGWKSGNKTGTGDNGSTNDIAIVWPPGRKPILLSVYYTGSTAPSAAREAVIADVARIVSKTLV